MTDNDVATLLSSCSDLAPESFVSIDKSDSCHRSGETFRMESLFRHALSPATCLRREAEWLQGQVGVSAEDAAVVSVGAQTGVPLTGIVVLRVTDSYRHTQARNSPSDEHKGQDEAGDVDYSAAGWVSCWLVVDVQHRRVHFHEHGPASKPSFALDCFRATLELPCLADFSAQLVFHLKGFCALSSPSSGSSARESANKTMSLKFQSGAEMMRWARALSAVCGAFSACGVSATCGESRAVLDSEVALAVTRALAERCMVRSSSRSLQLTGANLRSARFAQVGQRVVVQTKGGNEQLSEGSVVLSVNGLSAATVTATTMLKFIADFPRQMCADVVVWRFPRSEFHVDSLFVEVAAADTNSDYTPLGGTSSGRHTDSLQATTEKLASMFRLSTGRKEGDLPTQDVVEVGSGGSKLEQVLLRKRQSILLAPEGTAENVDVATIRGQQAAQESAAVRAAAETQKALGAVPMSAFLNARSADEVQWKSCRVMLASGALSVLRRDSGDLLCRMQLVSTQMRYVESFGDELLVELRDSKFHVIVRCPSPQVLLGLAVNITIACSLFSESADLSALYDISTERQLRRDSVFPSALGDRCADQTAEADVDLCQSALYRAVLGNQRKSSCAVVEEQYSELSVLSAAEALESTLSALRLPLSFPTAHIIEQQVREVCAMNLSNHRLLAQLLATQYAALHPPDPTQNNPTAVSKSAALQVAEDESGEGLSLQERAAAILEAGPVEVATADAITDKVFSHSLSGRRGSARLSMIVDTSTVASNPTAGTNAVPFSASNAVSKSTKVIFQALDPPCLSTFSRRPVC